MRVLTEDLINSLKAGLLTGYAQKKLKKYTCRHCKKELTANNPVLGEPVLPWKGHETHCPVLTAYKVETLMGEGTGRIVIEEGIEDGGTDHIHSVLATALKEAKDFGDLTTSSDGSLYWDFDTKELERYVHHILEKHAAPNQPRHRLILPFS